MSDKTILILGGGVGGIAAAHRLRKALPRPHRIVLVEREPDYLFTPSLLWLMVGLRQPDQIRRPLPALVGKGVECVRGRIERIDPESRTVRVDGRELTGDYLVVALGAELAPETIPGLAVAGHNFYTLAGAETLREARLQLREGRIVVLVSAMPFKCPAAPYEAAMLLHHDLVKRGLDASVKVDVYTAEPGPMPIAGPKVSAELRGLVESKGVPVCTEHATREVDVQSRTIRFANGATAGFDLLAYVPPHRAPAVIRESGLAGETGWIPVDPATLATRFPGVYAIGDVAHIVLKMGRPLPKAGVFAHREAEAVADNIAAAITGKGAPHAFDGHGECFIEIGGRKAGFGSGNFYADPVPAIRLRRPSTALHLGKLAFEKVWLSGWI